MMHNRFKEIFTAAEVLECSATSHSIICLSGSIYELLTLMCTLGKSFASLVSETNSCIDLSLSQTGGTRNRQRTLRAWCQSFNRTSYDRHRRRCCSEKKAY